MDASFLALSGWFIAIASLVVNVLQLLKNNDLKKKIATSTQTASGSAKPNQQVSFGDGGNFNSGRDINLTK